MNSTRRDWPAVPAPFEAQRERVALARRRQATLWRGETPDAWPLCCGSALTPFH